MQNQTASNLKPIFISVKELAHLINAAPGSINNLKFPNQKYNFNKYHNGGKVVFKLVEVEEWAANLQPVTSPSKRGRPLKTLPASLKGGAK